MAQIDAIDATEVGPGEYDDLDVGDVIAVPNAGDFEIVNRREGLAYGGDEITAVEIDGDREIETDELRFPTIIGAYALDEPGVTADDVVDQLGDTKRNPEITREWENGAFIVSFSYAGGAYAPLGDGTYYVPADADGIDEWRAIRGNGRSSDRRRRGELFAELDARLGVSDADETTMIPVEVATESKKAIAAYLFAVEEWDRERIADELGYAENTIGQYLSDFKAGRSG